MPRKILVVENDPFLRIMQIVLDPDRLRSYGITHNQVIDAVRRALGRSDLTIMTGGLGRL